MKKTFRDILKRLSTTILTSEIDTDSAVTQAEATLKKVIGIDEGKVNKILNKTSGCSTNCISCKELAKVISTHSAEILEFGGGE